MKFLMKLYRHYSILLCWRGGGGRRALPFPRPMFPRWYRALLKRLRGETRKKRRAAKKFETSGEWELTNARWTRLQAAGTCVTRPAGHSQEQCKSAGVVKDKSQSCVGLPNTACFITNQRSTFLNKLNTNQNAIFINTSGKVCTFTALFFRCWYSIF